MKSKQVSALAGLVLTLGLVCIWQYTERPDSMARGTYGGRVTELSDKHVAPQFGPDSGSEPVKSTELNATSGQKSPELTVDSARQTWISAYPRGLGAAVAEASDVANPNRAYELAEALSQCLHLDVHMAREREALAFSKTIDDRDAALRSLAFFESVNYQCQSVPGDIERVRLGLLRIAYEGGVQGAAVDYLLSLRSVSPTTPISPQVWASVERDAKNGDARSMARLASDFSDQSAVTSRDRAIYLNALSVLAGSGRVEDYSAARIGFYLAIFNSHQKGMLPQGVSSEKLSLSPEDMRRVLVGEWAIADAEGLKKVDLLVKAAKERSARS